MKTDESWCPFFATRWNCLLHFFLEFFCVSYKDKTGFRFEIVDGALQKVVVLMIACGQL